MSELVLFLLNGLSTFAFLALISVGLGLIFGELGIVNVAHGDFVMVGAFVMYALRDQPFLVGLAGALLFGMMLGYVLEGLILSRLYNRGFMPTLLATWGIGIVLRQAADAIFTSTPHSVGSPLPGSLVVFGVSYPTYRAASAIAIGVVIAIVLFFAYRTSFGLRVRASIDNVEMASLLGVSPHRMFSVAFTVGTVLAVLAGAFLAPLVGITPNLGLVYLAPAFFAVLLGRPGTIGGPVFGALLVAALQNILGQYFTATVAESFLFAGLVVLIAMQPEGLDWRLPPWIRKWLHRRQTAARTTG